jgi:hypothetical protein
MLNSSTRLLSLPAIGLQLARGFHHTCVLSKTFNTSTKIDL